MTAEQTLQSAPPAHHARTGTVLQIIPALDAGGAERTTVDVAAAVVAAGGRALVLATGGRLVPELEAAGADFRPFPAATKNPAAIVANGLALARLMTEEGVSLIHARSRAPAWSALIAARRTGLPLVTTYHGAYNQKSAVKGLYNGVMARGDAVIANSAYTADLIRARHQPRESALFVVPRGIDLATFDPTTVDPARISALRAAWGVEADDRIVLLPARLTAWKGQRVLIEAAHFLKARGLSGIAFVLAGDPQGRLDYVADLENRIARHDLPASVRIVGHCADMPAAYCAAAVTVVPSIEPEAFGRTPVEAQAMGSLAVVSEIGATSETVLAPPDVPDAERTGWRVPPGDAEALADGVEAALTLADETRLQIIARARHHVAARYGVDVMCRSTLAIYDQVAGTRFLQRVERS